MTVADELNSSTTDPGTDAAEIAPDPNAGRETRRGQACRAARIAHDYRSKDVVVLDLTGITPIVDYFVIATGTSRRQMHAVSDEISRVFREEEGDTRLGLEGYDNDSNWTLIDFGDIVIHLQEPEARDLYDLDHLWADARRVDWESEGVDNQPVEPGTEAELA